MKRGWGLTIIFFLLAACARQPAEPKATSTQPGSTLTADQAATLGSLQLVDPHPLYTMRFVGSYGSAAPAGSSRAALTGGVEPTCPAAWGCSLFAALGDESNRLYGRNFDWDFSPALLLFTDPADGYASVSMVDIKYLGFDGEPSKKIADLPLEDRRALLDAPFLPFDGMNEAGLAVGMAAVDREEMPYDPAKPTTDNLGVIRELLDHAGTAEEALAIFGRYNINMGSVPLHYLVASASGDSALVEFLDGEMKVFRNESPWQMATNFIVAATNGHPERQCRRYDRIGARLAELEGRISAAEAFRLLEDVSQDNTQWSIIYQMTTHELRVVMDRGYSDEAHTFRLGG